MILSISCYSCLVLESYRNASSMARRPSSQFATYSKNPATSRTRKIRFVRYGISRAAMKPISASILGTMEREGDNWGEPNPYQACHGTWYVHAKLLTLTSFLLYRLLLWSVLLSGINQKEASTSPLICMWLFLPF